MITKAIKAVLSRPQQTREVPARTFIKQHVDSKYATKLLSGLDSYLRANSINYHEYTLSNLKRDINTLAQQRGIGKVSIQHLREAIDAHENT